MAVLVPADLGAENGLTFPALYAGQKVYDATEAPELSVADIPGRVAEELQQLLSRLPRDARIGITAGSRGIANMPAILRACGDAIRDVGGDPFIIPAMGSP